MVTRKLDSFLETVNTRVNRSTGKAPKNVTMTYHKPPIATHKPPIYNLRGEQGDENSL